MIEIVAGDITKQHIDAIVNAANSSLLGGGGVDGAIHRAAGPEFLVECAILDGCPTGEARMTGAYQLDAEAVIHTVGPVWHGGHKGEPELLAECYRTSLGFAQMAHYESVAFPAISCGAYGYPLEAAARIAIETVAEHLEEHPRPSLVRFVLFTDDALNAWKKAYRARFGGGLPLC